MIRVFLIAFVVASVANVLSRLGGWTAVHWISKPAIITSLMLYYVSKTGANRSVRVLMALILSLCGDVALMFDTESAFIQGLAAFLVAHIFYMLSFRDHRHSSQGEALHGLQQIRLAFPVLLAGTGLVFVLYPALGNLRFPVILYAGVLVVMVLQAVFRLGRTNQTSFWLVASGAIMFMVSDSILALHKFLDIISYADTLTMSTDALAQYLLVEGLSRHTSR
jgi:uncharacterized membrane protein YhhN